MPSNVALELKDIDERILDLLADGRNVPANLAEALDVTRQYIHQRLALLEAAEYVDNIGRGVYELVEDPREDGVTATPVADALDALDRALDELPEGTPGRTAVEDARALLDREVNDD